MIMIWFDDGQAPARRNLLRHVVCFFMASNQIPAQPKPYVSTRELSALTPWTEQAIRTMISKGILRESEHFFHVGRRPVFK